MKKERKPIGKGLSALFEEMPAPETLRARPVQESPEPLDPEPAAVESAVPEIEIGKIDANPLQPRDEFDEATLRELSASIQAMGLIQPVTVRRDGDRYQLISGERRLRASRMAGLERIPAYVREADDTAALEMALVENIQREDLDPVEIALALRRLTEECSLTQEQLAEKADISRSHLSAIEAPNMVRGFSMDSFLNICGALDIDPAELINASMVPERILGDKSGK